MIEKKEDVTSENLAREMKDVARRFDVQDPKELLRFPQYFQIETTRLCNAKCPFCAIEQWDKSTPFMSDQLFEKIADEIGSYGNWVKFVDVQRSGEPLLDVKIYDRVAYMKSAGVPFVAITTNASGLTEKNARKLLVAGIDEVMISIDSVEKEAYERLRVGLHYDSVLRNIKDYFRLRDELRPNSIIRVRGVSFLDPSVEADRKQMVSWEAFWDKLRKPHDRIYLKRPHNWGNQVRMNGEGDYDLVYHPCVIPFSTMHISAMGKVALCPHDYDAVSNLGDINTQTIAEVWRGEKFQKVREQHSSGRRNEISYCRGCRSFDEDFSLERDKDIVRERVSRNLNTPV